MQAKRVGKVKPKTLRQGSVVKLQGLSFNVDGTPRQLSDFYPEIKFQNSEYGMVLTQTCDLVFDGQRLPKVSHILLCLLEPIKLHLNDLNLNSDKFLFQHQGVSTKIVNKDKYYESIWKGVRDIVDNNDARRFFVELPVKNTQKPLVANLCKMFPLKIEHYEALLKNTTYNLTTEFANKLAWKLAAFFGRIGTRDYGQQDRERIVRKIVSLISPEANGEEGPIFLSNVDFQKVNSHKGRPARQAEILQEILSREIDGNES